VPQKTTLALSTSGMIRLQTSLTSSFEKLAIGSAVYDARGLALDHHSHPSARRYTKRAAEGRRHVSVT